MIAVPRARSFRRDGGRALRRCEKCEGIGLFLISFR